MSRKDKFQKQIEKERGIFYEIDKLLNNNIVFYQKPKFHRWFCICGITIGASNIICPNCGIINSALINYLFPVEKEEYHYIKQPLFEDDLKVPYRRDYRLNSQAQNVMGFANYGYNSGSHDGIIDE